MTTQIVQLIPSSQHGKYFAWAVVGGVMHKIPLVVPRVFYLNSKAPITEELPGRRVNKVLPHGRRNHNLIEVRLCCHANSITGLSMICQLGRVFETIPLFFWCNSHIGKN